MCLGNRGTRKQGGMMIEVYDELTSHDKNNALSANMGRVLNEAIQALELRVVQLENNIIDVSNYKTIIW